MVFLFLPSMGKLALVLIRTALRVRSDEIVRFPIRAHFARIRENWGPSPIVLPIVCVNAYFSVVVVLTVGTPDCLEVEHVEIHVNLIVLDQLNWELCLIMRKWTKFLVIAFCIFDWFKIRRAEFCFVLVRMVEFFNSVMSFVTTIPVWTSLTPFIVWVLRLSTLPTSIIPSLTVCIRTHFRLVCS